MELYLISSFHITKEEAAMSLIFRTMTPEDFPACALELMAAFGEAPWNEVWTYEQAHTRIDEMMSGRVSRGYVCMDGDVCVSMLCGRIMTYQDWKQLFIDEFSVHPDYQRQGIGSRMMAFVREELKKEPFAMSYLCLNTEKGFPSVKFYEHNGFWPLDNNLCMGASVNWP